MRTGGKIFLPPAALEQLSRLNIEYPMLFSVTSEKTGRKTHCGVLEFVADPGMCHLPAWMMANLAIGEGDTVTITNLTLPRGTYAKLQPQSVDFYEISDHRAVLENSLRTFSSLTEGDNFTIDYNNKTYDIVVLKVAPETPSKAVSIVETDLQIDFAPALGMPDEPVRGSANNSGGSSGKPGSGAESAGPAVDPTETLRKREEEEIKKTVFRPFTGGGARLDGKKPKTDVTSPVVAGPTSEAARRDAERRARAQAAQTRFTAGKLRFGSAPGPPPKKTDSSTESSESSTGNANGGTTYFSGKGRSLRD